ncbi:MULTISPECIES: HPP family protein [Pseudomonas]|uniref:HPP family protein n=1 Tax=Pseudomonas quercus TaxID=2722792 RepID=A0ABX0YCQ0_9PSED|nr:MULTISPECIES: HPP family protein [Pseudomonas]MBF7141324.1 HPP family protein [Pseudomonas sp. LY10J]NJO99857.1 HPP family protein [Pseudomonas quercus]
MPVRSSFYRRIIGAISAFWPSRQPISLREKCRASLGATLGTLVVALLAAAWVEGLLAHQHSLLSLALVAPLGASAVLVFAVPSSPLAQPWSVVGGNTLSALVGIACFKCIPDASLAAGLAVGLAMGVMFAFRCLHPPGGASALLMVLMGCDRFSFAISPVLLDSLLLVGSGLLYNNLTGRSWPHVPRPAAISETTRLHRADLDAVLARHNELLDISTDDLQTLLEQVESMTYQRTLGHVRCADVMSATPLTARVDMTLAEAWAVVRKHRIKALPVVDSRQHVLGIVTVADFMRQIDLEVHEGLGQRLRALVRPQPVQVRQVGQIMTRTVRVASYDRLLIDLVPVFSKNGHRHIPIIDESQRLVGIITQSDLVRALYTAVRA